MPEIESRYATGAVWTGMRTVRGGRSVRVVVIHTMEAPEGPNTALSIATYFASGSVQASAHYNLDANNVIQGVPEYDDAWAAPPSNPWGIQLEHAGYAAQTIAEWSDAYSTQMLERSAQLVADICLRNGITPRHLTDAQLAAGWDGIVGHIQVSSVWGQSSHWDPGYSFPWDGYMARVGAYYTAQKTGQAAPSAAAITKTAEREWDEMASKAEVQAACKSAVKDAIINDLDGNLRSKVNRVLSQELRGYLAERAQAGATTALNAAITKQGIDGGKKTSVAGEAAWRNFRDNQTDAKIDAIAAQVQELKAGQTTPAAVAVEGGSVSTEALAGLIRQVVREEISATRLAAQEGAAA